MGAGSAFCRSLEAGEIRFAGITLFGNCARVHGPLAQLVDCGSKIPTPNALKSPPRAAAVGIDTSVGAVPVRYRNPSYDPKKKMRFLLIGPPTFTPYSFWC